MLVRIKNEWLDSDDERNMVYVVTEDNGDRLIIRENRLPKFNNEIIPTQLVRSHMIEEI